MQSPSCLLRLQPRGFQALSSHSLPGFSFLVFPSPASFLLADFTCLSKKMGRLERGRERTGHGNVGAGEMYLVPEYMSVVLQEPKAGIC